MKEKTIILWACFVLLAIGVVSFYFSMFNTGFNFYKSEISVNGTEIVEKLYFSPDKSYHTLYRTFVDPLFASSPYGNSEKIIDVKCSQGVPYAYARDGFYTFSSGKAEMSSNRAYTQENEYGCNFGSDYGFFRGEEYTLEATFILNPSNLFEIDGKKYIKFVAYSPKNHVFLSRVNFIVKGRAALNGLYASEDNVIIYIPYEPNANENIIQLNDFEYDRSYGIYLLSLLLCLIPAIGLYLVWLFLGKENIESEVPEDLSDYPTKRKGWQVAAYFNPPFNEIDKHFISALVLDLYQRKIIDVKTEKGFFSDKCFIKILNKSAALDDVESNFIDTINLLANDGKNLKDGYVDISSASEGFFMKMRVQKKYKELESLVKDTGKQYVNVLGSMVYLFGMIFLVFIAMINELSGVIYPSVAGVIFSVISSATSSLLVSFKESYYDEYVKWQAFKRHLNNAPSLKLHKSRGVVIWGEYLIYAAAFGIAESVIKELRAQGLISEQQFSAYVVSTHTSTSFVSATGYSSSGGGHGGAGGGGVGGGGGGGR